MRLVAVTRILNEDDIVEAFVRHHAPMVDHHLLLDNGSVDGTLEILRQLKNEGFALTVLQNEAPFYTEVDYNTDLFRRAWADLGADWVLFLDTDEFLDARGAQADVRGVLSALPATTEAVRLESLIYYDLPDDDANELLVPVRMRRRETPRQQPVTKIFVRGALADQGVAIDGGQHDALRNGTSVPAYTGHGLRLGHYFRRSAWQSISKAVLGWLKVLAAGQGEVSKGRSGHYYEPFRAYRDAPETLIRDPGYMSPNYDWIDMVEDPLPYLGGPLRYTVPPDPEMKALRVMTAYAEQLAKHHGMLIDTCDGARSQAADTARNLQILF